MQNIFKEELERQGLTYQALGDKINWTRGNAHVLINDPARMGKKAVFKLCAALHIDKDKAISCWKEFKVKKYRDSL